MNFRTINGEKIKLTKNGEIAKNQYGKIKMSYLKRYESHQRAWEFHAMVDGVESASGLEERRMRDFFWAIYRQFSSEFIA